MLAPMLVQMERQIDREIAADQKKSGQCVENESESGLGDGEDSDSEMEDEQLMLTYGPLPQIVTNDLKSLDEMVSGEDSSSRVFGDVLTCVSRHCRRYGVSWMRTHENKGIVLCCAQLENLRNIIQVQDILTYSTPPLSHLKNSRMKNNNCI